MMTARRGPSIVVAAAVLALCVAGCGDDSIAHLPTGPSAHTHDGFSGLRYDSITTAHTLLFGTPISTQNQAQTYCCWPIPMRNAGQYTFDLANFPLGILPSGGSSNIVSDSEMMIAGLNTSPSAGVMRFEWHKAVTTDTVIFTFASQPTSTWAYSYIGRFSWEVNEPGHYYLLIDSNWGRARLDFQVTNSGTDAFLRAAPLGAEAQRWIGRTGGFGEGRDDRPR